MYESRCMTSHFNPILPGWGFDATRGLSRNNFKPGSSGLSNTTGLSINNRCYCLTTEEQSLIIVDFQACY